MPNAEFSFEISIVGAAALFLLLISRICVRTAIFMNLLLMPICLARIMGPGGYKIIDFVKAIGIMPLLFLCVSMVAINVFF